jgi:hypothetical protein
MEVVCDAASEDNDHGVFAFSTPWLGLPVPVVALLVKLY